MRQKKPKHEMAHRVKPLHEGTELYERIQNALPGLNAARTKFVTLFVMGLVKAQTVCLEKVSMCFSDGAKGSSSLKRTQRFLRGFLLDMDMLARCLAVLGGLASHDRWTLVLDRTNWCYGSCHLNVLVLGVSLEGRFVPLMWTLLEKKGCSYQRERIALLERFLAVFGRGKVAELVADREFLGSEWLAWLRKNKVSYVLRLRANLRIYTSKGRTRTIGKHFGHLCVGADVAPKRSYMLVGGQRVWLRICRLKDDWLLLAYPDKREAVKQAYSKRWGIETFFKSLKSNGFNIEATHVTHKERFSKLFALVAIAYTVCAAVGEYVHRQQICKISFAKSEPMKSFFKHGLLILCEDLCKTMKNKQLNRYIAFLSH